MYSIGEGSTSILISGGLFLYGKVSKDYRAISTASQIIQAQLVMGITTQFIKRISGRESPFSAALFTQRSMRGTVICAQPANDPICLVQLASSCFGEQSIVQFEPRRIEIAEMSTECTNIVQAFNSPNCPAGVLYSRNYTVLPKIPIISDFDGFDHKVFWQDSEPFSTVRAMIRYLQG